MNYLRALGRDTRGAVYVLGIAMAAFLALFLWHIMSVADALVYRERMQEAADSVAFESAVMHARTMNLLSAINIIMAAVLSILVMVRFIELILGIAAAILWVLCGIPFLQFACGPAETVTNFLSKVIQKDVQKISPKVKKALTRLHKAQEVVSSAAPLPDVLVPSVKNMAYFKAPVNGVFAVSFAVVPAAVIPPTRMGTSSALPAMPIEEGSFDVLCKKAAEFWFGSGSTDNLNKTGGGEAASAISGFGQVMGAIAGAAPELFCNDGAPQSYAKNATKDLAKQKCDAEKKAADDAKKKYTQADYLKCMSNPPKVDTPGALDKQNPAAVWSNATNGNPFLQVWGIANGDPPEVSTVKFGEVKDKQAYHWSLAQAEFFSDCAEGNAPWSACEPLAMWHLWWKARLRRVIDPVQALSDSAKGAVVGAPAALLDMAVGKVVGAASKGPVSAAFASAGGGLLTQMVSGYLPDTTALADRIPTPPRSEIVH
jgi:hypothetical protein